MSHSSKYRYSPESLPNKINYPIGHPSCSTCPTCGKDPDNNLSIALQAKLAGIVVHADEYLNEGDHPFDKTALQMLLSDSEVQIWIKSLGPLAPVKRSKR